MRRTFGRTHRIDVPSETTQPDRIKCSICGFPGVDIETVPAARLGLKATTTTGSTYVWTNADDDITTMDKAVEVTESQGVCPSCKGELFLSGSKGSGNRIP